MSKLLRYILMPYTWIKNWFVRRLLRLRAKLQIGTLRAAIHDADQNKAETGRKNMVVFNSTSGKFEPVQKRLLKVASKSGRNNSNKAMTAGRLRVIKKKKRRIIDPERIKQVEKKSLYVTK